MVISSRKFFKADRYRYVVPIFITGLVVTLRMFHGELEQVKKEEPVLLRGVNVVKKLGFPDVIMPGKTQCCPLVNKSEKLLQNKLNK